MTTSSIVDLAWRSLVTITAAPWLVVLRWLSWAAGLQLSLLSSLGVRPAGFVPQAQLRELDGVLAHMHLREDQYRQAIAELQEALEAREGDKKKALRSLKKTRMEVEMLAEQLAQLQEQPAGAGSSRGGEGGSAQPSLRGLHLSMALLACASFWYYQQDQSPLHRKLVFTVLSPLAWIYLSALLAHKAHRPAWGRMVLLQCAVWALLGFIAGSLLASPC
ncbi:hypothetical protein ABPG77_000150 [Micractinium sp. CCAP 211/92]